MLPGEIAVEDALNDVLVDFLEIVNSVKSVRELDNIVVELTDLKTTSVFPRVNKSLGSISVSICGSVIAHVSGKPVFFNGEKFNEDNVVGFFRVGE